MYHTSKHYTDAIKYILFIGSCILFLSWGLQVFALYIYTDVCVCVCDALVLLKVIPISDHFHIL